MPVIGFLSIGSREADISRMNAVRRGLAEIGYVEGQNVAIEYRGAQYQHDRLPALAVDLVSRQPAVIIVVSTSATLAAKAATNTIPIVFSIGCLGSFATAIVPLGQRRDEPVQFLEVVDAAANQIQGHQLSLIGVFP